MFLVRLGSWCAFYPCVGGPSGGDCVLIPVCHCWCPNMFGQSDTLRTPVQTSTVSLHGPCTVLANESEKKKKKRMQIRKVPEDGRKIFIFYYAQVAALDIHHAASRSNEKITNSNSNIAELTMKLTRAASDWKQACASGLCPYLPATAARIWQAVYGDNSLSNPLHHHCSQLCEQKVGALLLHLLTLITERKKDKQN